MILLFFRRQGITIHKQEFGTVQTNAFGTIAMGAIHVFDGPDIGADFNAVTVGGLGWQLFEFCQFSLFSQELGLCCLERGQFVGAWVDQHLIVQGVQNQKVTRFDLRGDVVGSHNRRQLQGAGHDGGMRGTATDIGDKATHEIQIDLCRF